MPFLHYSVVFFGVAVPIQAGITGTCGNHGIYITYNT